MRNSGPEKTFVEPLVLNWLKANGFDPTVVDTSAVWNPQANRYLRRQASESLPDIIANHGSLSCWIELKAPGQRSAINSKKSIHQRIFLIRKIRAGCFACVTDGVEHLRNLWSEYLNAETSTDKMHVLLMDLPEFRDSRQLTFSKPRR